MSNSRISVLVSARAGLEDRYRAQQSWFGAQVLHQDDVVREVRDAVFGQAADLEQVGYFAGHDRAYACAREALHVRVDELAEAHGIGRRGVATRRVERHHVAAAAGAAA
jgi:hypothetical protein